MGGHVQALGLARQAYAQKIKVILFISDEYSITKFSKTVDEVVIFGHRSKLDQYLKPYENQQTLLFPTSDEFIEYINEHYDALKNKFYLGIPSQECINIFSDKAKTYQFAEKNGIPYPHSWYPQTTDDIEIISQKADFPLVVKPNVMYSFHKLFGKKAFLCKNKQELFTLFSQIEKKMPVSGVVIQEFLCGGAKTLYSYGTFAVKGEPKAWVVANRIRQNPMDFGNSTTFAITCDNPDVERIAKHILRATNYTGLAEVEFMYDEKTGQYKFLEVNTRAWKWHSISTGMGFGFLSEMIHHFNGEQGDFHPSAKKIAWVERFTDFSIIAKETLRGKMRISEVISTYRYPKISAVWSWNDPLPVIMYIILSPILFVKRY